jgi:apolipoprotein N-acyltransferase
VTELALGAAFALLFALSFPFRAGDFGFDVGIAAGWLALAPLWLLVRGQRPWVAFRRVLAATSAGYALVWWWLYIVITVYGRAPAFAGAGGALGVAVYAGVIASAAIALAAFLAPQAGRAAPFLLPAAWVLAERARAPVNLAGFPWAFLGYAAHADAPLRGAASLCGVYGLSFALALAGVWLAERRFASALALAAGLHAVGWLALPGALAAPDPPLRAALIQGNIPQDEKWDPALAQRNFAVQLDLSRQALREHPDVVLWAEASTAALILLPRQDRIFPGLAEMQADFREPLLALARESGATFIVGGLGVTDVPGERQAHVHNSVFVLSPTDGIVDRYDKAVLVPFGEYVPLRSVFGSLGAVATSLADMADITPGSGERTLAGLSRFGPERAPTGLICYEVVYPSLVRQAVRGGARLLLNLTNDAWYGKSSAPIQFLAIAQLRSAEHGLPMLRVANTGVSALIDAGGAVLESTPIFEPRVLAVQPPPPRASATPYTRLGDWPLYGSAALLLFIGGRRLVGRRQR